MYLLIFSLWKTFWDRKPIRGRMWIKVIDDNNKQCSTRDFPIFPPDVGSTSNTQFYTLFEDNLGFCAFTKFDVPKKLRYIIETTTTENSEFDFCKSLLGSGAFEIQMEWKGISNLCLVINFCYRLEYWHYNQWVRYMD